MRILIVDDHGLFAEGLQNLLQAGGHRVVGQAYDGMEALALAREHHPELILMDIRMPKCNGLEATRLIKNEFPDIWIVILTTSTDEADLFEALKGGADGYLLKNLKPNVLFNYLEGLKRGESPLSRELAGRLLSVFSNQRRDIEQQHPADGSHEQTLEERALEPTEPSELADEVNGAKHPSDLTVRQREILEMVVEGLSYKEIGAELHLSENTIKYHMREIFQRLHVRNREQVVTHTLRTGKNYVPSDKKPEK
jgi:two-component system NarL family response regulator